jgi:hypothetical protein
MPEVISNTTPMQYLHQLGLLQLLPRFYNQIVLPGRVADEIRTGKALGVDLPHVDGLSWLNVRSAPPSTWPLPADIHAGEAEVLALGLGSPESLLLLDDGVARRYAKTLGLRFTGTLGILLRAKRDGIIAAVRPFLDNLDGLGFRLASTTRQEALRLAQDSTTP